MTISNLYAKFAYQPAASNVPLVVFMHGMSSGASSYNDNVLQRWANLGVFAVAVGMRGRDGASGSPDFMAREAQDIADAVAYVRANYATQVDATNAAIVGYSAGGGAALAMAAKFPDLFSVVVDHFGMSDPGVDATLGWYYQNTTYDTILQTWVGGTPAAVPDRYRARNHLEAVATNFTGGYLYVFHDNQDTIVPVNQSTRLVTNLVSASRTNYETHYSDANQYPRWFHGQPDDQDSPLNQSEAIWGPVVAAKTHAAWTVAATGTVKVLGYIVTKRFSLWLDDGTHGAATVVYDTTAHTYTVTPLTTTPISVKVVEGARTVTQSISTATTLTAV